MVQGESQPVKKSVNSSLVRRWRGEFRNSVRASAEPAAMMKQKIFILAKDSESLERWKASGPRAAESDQ